MSAHERLKLVRTRLKQQFIERDHVIDGALIALLCKQHLIMLGPPGTAKSMLAQALCQRTVGGRRDATYFEWLLTKFTTPEEIFGPVSLPALEQGRYERVTAHKLPEAKVCFLDEIFKANSAILNALLTILNERRFHNGTEVSDVPLESLFSASNELPEEDELGALYDRFLLRYTVGYIEKDHLFLRLLALDDDDGAESREENDAVAALQPEDLAALQAEVLTVHIPDTVLEDILEVRKALTTEGVIASDRRYRQALTALRASALLEGRDRVNTHDLALLQHILWSDPDEQSKVAKALAKVASGFEQEARRLLAQAEEIASYGRRAWPDLQSRNRALIECHTKLHTIHQRVQSMVQAARARERDTSHLDAIVNRVASLQQGLVGTRN